MNAARWLLGLSTSFAVCASVATGCGGNSTGAAAIDSGSGADVTTEAAIEAAVEALAPEAAPVMEASVDAACVPDANLNDLPVPDASFGDAGATAASCVACFQTNCPSVIAMCNMNCACVGAFEQFAACLGKGGSPTTCAGALIGVSGISQSQLICALPCVTSPSICGVSIPAGGDGGAADGGASDGAIGGDAAGE